MLESPTPEIALERCTADARLRLDCRHFRGDRPCAAGVPTACPANCQHYAARGHRILVIKLAALGDVVRTTALLPGLKTRWPNAHITWITSPAGTRMLANHPQIDRLLPFDAATLLHLEIEDFDLCLSLDKEPGPAALAMRIRAADRRGIGWSRSGAPYPLNEDCVRYFELGLDNHLKFNGNRYTYPQMIYAAVGLPYRDERFRLYPTDANRAAAAATWSSLGIRSDETVIGLNTGAGGVFANKTLPASKFATLARVLTGRHGWRIALLGGPAEQPKHREILAACADLRDAEHRTPLVVDAGTGHAELEFAALLARCNVVVTGDSMAMHVAIAADIPVVALFGPTCPQEIDLYGRGAKLLTGLSCAPCYRRSCDKSPNCMDDISTERVAAEVERWAHANVRTPCAEHGIRHRLAVLASHA